MAETDRGVTPADYCATLQVFAGMRDRLESDRAVVRDQFGVTAISVEGMECCSVFVQDPSVRVGCCACAAALRERLVAARPSWGVELVS